MNTSSSPQPSDSGERDDSRYWVAGGFYVNPDNPRLFVLKRSHTGWTLNFAHPIAWWLSGGFFVLLSLIELLFYMLFHSIINLVLLCIFLAFCLMLLVGFIRIHTARKS